MTSPQNNYKIIKIMNIKKIEFHVKKRIFNIKIKEYAKVS